MGHRDELSTFDLLIDDASAPWSSAVVRELHDSGELVLEQGHETPASTVLDAEYDEVLRMPASSWAPLLLAAALTGIFVMLLLGHAITAAAFAAAAAVVLLRWHSVEPQDA